MERVFIIRPFGQKEDSAGKEIDFDKVEEDLIFPALEDPVLKDFDLKGGTTQEIVEPGNIHEDMFALILEADVVICDITIHNANVFYELGVRHALRTKRTILIKGSPSNDSTPFDIKPDRYTSYKIDDPKGAKDKLVKTLKISLESKKRTDSPIFKMLPDLSQADQLSNMIIPEDLLEKVELAAKASQIDTLQKLSKEVRGKRFGRGGLKVIGKAQWELKDFAGAQESWEAIRKTQPKDIDANLALANIYERLSREENRLGEITKSDQAINRVIDNSETSKQQKAEALTLKGRNQKTQWRRKLKENDKDHNRKHALSRQLLASYEAYYEAYLYDLNHFYPGLNAFQMATILLDLSSDTEGWDDMFDSDEEAGLAKIELDKRVKALEAMVPLSVKSALKIMEKDDKERIWAEISAADLLFLTDKRLTRINAAYKNAIPHNQAFAWDAARGQLKLFADLGVKEEMAREVIENLDMYFADA